MDASALLWKHRQQQVKELFSPLHGHQQKTLALLVIGIVLAGCAVLQRVAETLSLEGISPARMPSIERRLARFLANERIIVSEVWQHFLQPVLPGFRHSKLHFVLDATPYTDEAVVLYLGVLVHSRVLPVAWCCMPAQTKWDEGPWSIVGRLLATPTTCAMRYAPCSK